MSGWSGGCLPGPGGCLPGPGGGGSGIPACTEGGCTLPPCGQTHTCKNITLATTSLRPVTRVFSYLCLGKVLISNGDTTVMR